GGLGTWAATAKLAGAVVASGQLRVSGEQQVVQHPDGGVVGEILVSEGDRVDGGEILVRLDGTSLRSELSALEGQLYELMARRGRLAAEQAERDGIRFDTELSETADRDPDVRELVEGQRSLFEARRQTMEREMEVMDERQSQIREQIEGAKAEIAALKRQTELIEAELIGIRRLKEQGLARNDRVLSLEREAARLAGETGQMIAQNARLKGQISELEQEKLRMKDSRREEAISELREIGFRELELKQKRIQLKEQIDRLDIRAPRSGIVYDMKVHALKSVIRPADPIMFVVPTDTGMVIEARVEPIDIDNVYLGQDAALRFSAFNARTTPELGGYVKKISADAFTDEQTGVQYYKVDIELDDGELDKLEGQELVAGMPVETHIQTGERTPLNYMVKPLTDYMSRALTEE
ncbi:MAG TPA: HlyD family type I secretion periplasmic adaptor subunit, partial [Myxococcota bacterium]|nr:HlyD family type I secretion periplasmic adaptor subunit [Myxococcota bacterium]